MNEKTFSYTYSAPVNQEVLNIRKKYMPREETRLEELKRLDNTVQNSGVMESLCAGISGCMMFGLGLCLAMQVIDTGAFHTALGIALGVVGMIGMISAYPLYRKMTKKAKAEYTPRILKLVAEFMMNNEKGVFENENR